MKQFIAVCLTACLILPVSGTFLWLTFQRQQVRKEVKHTLMANANKKDLTLLVFSKAESETLHWKHEKEFEFRGTMYDIVSSTTKNDSIYYRVFPDRKETKLNRQLEKLATNAYGNDPLQKEKQRQLRLFLTALFFSKQQPWAPCNPSSTSMAYYHYPETFHSIVLPLDDPPPQRILHT